MRNKEALLTIAMACLLAALSLFAMHYSGAAKLPGLMSLQQTEGCGVTYPQEEFMALLQESGMWSGDERTPDLASAFPQLPQRGIGAPFRP